MPISDMWEKESYVASELLKRRRARGLTQDQLAKSMAPKMYLSTSTARSLISSYENGYFHVSGDRNGGTHLTRIALYIKELHLDDKVLGRVNTTLKEIDMGYEYPPDETKLTRIKMTRLAG